MGGLQDSIVSPSHFEFNWVFELVGTCFRRGLGGFWTKGLGLGLDNIKHFQFIQKDIWKGNKEEDINICSVIYFKNFIT